MGRLIVNPVAISFVLDGHNSTYSTPLVEIAAAMSTITQ